MISKEDVLNLIYKINIDKETTDVQSFIEMIKTKNNEEFQELLNESNINTLEEVEQFIIAKFKNSPLPQIALNNLDLEHTFFHFANKIAFDSIAHNGLISQIGDRANGVESKELIFFSEGAENVLRLCNTWIKWIMHRTYGEKNQFGYYASKDECLSSQSSWCKEFLNKEYLNDEEKKKYVFELVMSGMKERIYFALELKEGQDFSYFDIDYNKQSALNDKLKGNIKPYLFEKEMYSDYSNVDVATMDKWNMHTLHQTEKIEPCKITQIIDSKGPTDMLSIVFELYEKYKGQDLACDILDDFIEYAKIRELANQANQSQEKQGDSVEETEPPIVITELKFAQIYDKSKGKIKKIFSTIKSFIDKKNKVNYEKTNNDSDENILE